MKKSEVQKILEINFPEKTDQAIQIMIIGFEKLKKELLIKLQKRNTNPEILKIIEDFK